jgi:hypothetical protein
MSNVFKFPHARRRDPATSHAAAGSIDISAQAWKVLQAYKTGRAMLDHDAYKLVGIAEEDQKRFAHQRCSDLRAARLIERTGDRGITPSGKAGYLCRITEEGKNFIASGGKTTQPTPTTGAKMPVDISKRVAQYVALRDLIKVKEAEQKKELEKHKKCLEDLNAILLNHLNEIGGNSLNTDAGTVYKTEKKSAPLADPAAFMSYVIDTQAFDLLDRKANVTAVTEFIKQNGAPPPGVSFSTAFVVGVRRPGQDKQEKKND